MEIPINPGSITMMIILAGAIFLAYGKYSYEKDLKNKKNKKYISQNVKNFFKFRTKNDKQIKQLVLKYL